MYYNFSQLKAIALQNELGHYLFSKNNTILKNLAYYYVHQDEDSELAREALDKARKAHWNQIIRSKNRGGSNVFDAENYMGVKGSISRSNYHISNSNPKLVRKLQRYVEGMKRPDRASRKQVRRDELSGKNDELREKGYI